MVDEFTQFGRSLIYIYIRNSSGPRTVPWGTPDVTGLESDDIPSKTTVCSRSVRKDEIHPRVVPVTPIASSFLSSLENNNSLNHSYVREVKLKFYFVAKNHFYFFLKGVAIRSKLLFISGV